MALAVPVQAIDLIDEAGSRVRISAYNARKDGAMREDPKVDEYLQVRGGGAAGQLHPTARRGRSTARSRRMA